MGSTAGEHITPGHATSTSRPGVLVTELGLVAMAVIWGANFTVVKYGTTFVSPLAYNGVRIAIAAAILCAIVWIGRTPLPPGRTIGALLALGVLGNGIYQYFFIEGIAHTRASDAALVVAATPAFVALIGRIRGVERVSWRSVAGMALSMTGIAFVVLGSARSTDGRSSLLGNCLILGGSAAWAVFTVLLKPFTARVSGPQISAFTMAGGALMFVLVAAPAIVTAPWAGMPTLAWVALIFSAVFALVIAYYFWYRGVRVIGPTRTAMFSNLQPIIAVLVAWALLHETPTSWQCVGGGCVMTGLLLTRS
jgi:drug/metabolite transporter (DMT)-like permease